VSRITFFLSYLCRSQHTFQILDRDRIPQREPRTPPSMFFTLMVVAPGSPSAPPREPTVDVSYVNGVCFRFYSFGTSQVARRRCFLHSWWVLPDIYQHPSEGPPLMFFYVDGGCSRFYSSGTSQVARRRYFLCSWWMLPDLCQHLPGGHRRHFLR
jgi:hypothetical protein